MGGIFKKGIGNSDPLNAHVGAGKVTRKKERQDGGRRGRRKKRKAEASREIGEGGNDKGHREPPSRSSPSQKRGDKGEGIK